MAVNGEPTNEPNAKDLEFRVRHVDGEVVIEFNHQIKHFRLHPELSIRLSESIIAASVAAAHYLQQKKSVIVAVDKKALILPGLPQGKPIG